ncbi:hypothetical protein ACP70R_048084 [Stipagrostis hirtigluma subsp. patula]
MAGTDRRAAAAGVVLFPLPFQGHLTPMLQLAGSLHARGLAVTVLHAAAFNAPDPARHPEFAFVPVPVAVPDEVAAATDGMAKVFALNATMDASGCVRDALASLIQKPEAPRLAGLVIDAALPAAQKAAASLGLPRLVLNTGSAACLRLFCSYDMLHAKGYLPTTESNLDLPVKELPPLKVRDLFDPSKLPNQESVQKMMDLGIQTTRNSSGVIINTFEALEAHELERVGEELGVAAFAVGPLHKLSSINGAETSLLEEDHSCIEWLNTQSPCSVLYVSFGSLAHVTQHEFTEVAWGLANSAKPFLWVVRPGLVFGMEKPELPEEFKHAVEDRGKVVEWAPQKEVLAHPAVGGFWTHSGWNSTLESIYEGVPMLSRPIFGDQLVNGRYVEDVWKIGFLLEGVLEQGKIEKAIRRLMEEKEGVEARERAIDLKKKALMCLENNGSSQQAVDKLVDYMLSG